MDRGQLEIEKREEIVLCLMVCCGFLDDGLIKAERSSCTYNKLLVNY